MDLKELKGRVDTVQLAEKRWGVQFKSGGGGRMKACCPLHQETEASFVVYPDGGWTCFGACNRSGDVFDLVQLRDNLDVGAAIREVAAFAGVTLTPLTPQAKAKMSARRTLEETLAAAAAYFHERLLATPKALDYCRWRGWDDETIRAHGLGYNDGTVHVALRQAGVVIESKPAKAVLSIPRGMLVYPHREQGRMVYLSGRLADRERKGHYNPPTQLIGSRRPMWNAVHSRDEVVIVEGQADAVTLGGWGIAAVALAGCGLTVPSGQEMARRLSNIRQVYVWPDADGNTDLAGLAETLGPMMRVIAPPAGARDANHWLQGGATAKQARKLLGQAEPWMLVLIGDAARSKNEDDLKAVMRAFESLDVWGQAAWRKRICRGLDLTVDEMRAMVKAVQDEDEAGPVRQDDYVIRQGMLCRVVPGEYGTVYRALGNFTAHLVEDILEDDGEEIERRFALEGELASGGRLPRIEVEAREFINMKWLAGLWGARVMVAAGQSTRDHLRASIQALSENVHLRHEFSHLGWRESDGARFYLSAAGAVGREGVQVRFIHDLDNYRLPTMPENTREAMRDSLDFLDVGDYSITVPLWAAMFLAPLSSIVPPPFTLWLYGTTGTLKSTATALAMCHYGAFAYNTPPASWTGTTNALEKKAFLVKDSPLWIDDYTAQSSLRGMDEIRRKADRLLRDWGNRTGRSRMQSNLRLRRTFAPRGLIISTAEQLPPGQSILARLFTIEVHPGMIPTGADSALTQAQVTGSKQYAHAMAGYLLWLAGNWPHWQVSLREKLLEYTELARSEGDEHLRMPGNVATMFIGLEMGLKYAEAVGAIEGTLARDLRDVGWGVLLASGKEQHQVVVEEKPVEMYMRALEQMMAQGTVFLHHRKHHGDFQHALPEQRALHAEHLGWYDDFLFYLLPDATYNAVCQFYRAGGRIFPDTQQGVRVKLHEERLLVKQKQRYTYRLPLSNGAKPRVLRIGRPGDGERRGDRKLPLEFLDPIKQ